MSLFHQARRARSAQKSIGTGSRFPSPLFPWVCRGFETQSGGGPGNRAKESPLKSLRHRTLDF